MHTNLYIKVMYNSHTYLPPHHYLRLPRLHHPQRTHRRLPRGQSPRPLTSVWLLVGSLEPLRVKEVNQTNEYGIKSVPQVELKQIIERIKVRFN